MIANVIAEYARDNGIEKFDPSDVNDYLMGLAHEYAENYEGTFSFMVDMKQDALYGDLSKNKAKGVLNCALAEARRNTYQTNEVVAEKSAPVERYIPNGTYTVVFPDGDYRTLRLVDDWREGETGQVAQFLSGSDNENSYTGFAFVNGQTAHVWKRFKDYSEIAQALAMLLADKETAAEYGYNYAMESGNCYRCGRKLTVPASISRGLGPICAELIGA